MKQIIFIGIAVLALASCNSKSAPQEVTYDANLKGFYLSDEDGETTYNMIALEKVHFNWDQKTEKDFNTINATDILVKVELRSWNSTSTSDIPAYDETVFELYDAVKKKTYEALGSDNIAATFVNGHGYAMYSVPASTKLEDLYIGFNTGSEVHDWTKEDVKTLLPLKKVEMSFAEKTEALNITKPVVDFDDANVNYTFKSITYNCMDAEVKKYLAEYDVDTVGRVFVRVDIDIKSDVDADFYDPYLITEYEVLANEFLAGDHEEGLMGGVSTPFAYYFQLPKGEKILRISESASEEEDSDYYNVPVKH